MKICRRCDELGRSWGLLVYFGGGEALFKTVSFKQGWMRGIAQASPVMMGYLPIGFAYGVLAQKAGFSTLNTVLMSLLVYAGSAQFIAVALFAGGAPALSIVATTFVVNLRHLLLSAALSPHLRGWRKGELAAFAYELTDETFAQHAVRASRGPLSKAETFAINLASQVAWIFGSWLGAVAGGLIRDVKPLALDYVLAAMFIALLVLQIRDRVQIGVALFSGLLAVGLILVGLDRWSVIWATVIAAMAGVGVEQWIKNRS